MNRARIDEGPPTLGPWFLLCDKCGGESVVLVQGHTKAIVGMDYTYKAVPFRCVGHDRGGNSILVCVACDGSGSVFAD